MSQSLHGDVRGLRGGGGGVCVCVCMYACVFVWLALSAHTPFHYYILPVYVILFF